MAVPWAREGSGFTLLFEALAMLLCREMPMALATLSGNTTPGSARGGPLCRSGPRSELVGEVPAISVDETSARRGHRYVTNVLDAQTHELL